jgi:hypothetical protein
MALTAGSEILGRLPIGNGRIHGAARYPKKAEAPCGPPVPEEATLAPQRSVVGGISLVEGGDDLGEECIGLFTSGA